MMRNKTLLIGVVIGLLLSTAGIVLAGSLDPSVGPTGAASQMFTLQQLYDRLNTGAAATKMTTFTEPSSGPTAGTMRTLDEIMAKAPATDNTNGATAAQVLSGKTFWGLRTDGTWGLKTGTMANNGAGGTVTPGTANQTKAAGYYSSAITILGDSDLVADNIKSGVTIFNVTGSYAGAGGGGCTCNGTLNGTRWCDNGNGTVTDLNSCLVWLKNASWGGLQVWDGWFQLSPNATAIADAHTRVSSLQAGSTGANLSDGSVQGDWHLPTKTELIELMTGTEPVSDSTMRAFTGVQGVYWSSTVSATNLEFAYYVILGYAGLDYRYSQHYVWPVRGQ